MLFVTPCTKTGQCVPSIMFVQQLKRMIPSLCVIVNNSHDRIELDFVSEFIQEGLAVAFAAIL